MPDGGSRAAYIIVCNGRIDVAVSKNGFEMMQSASRAATALVTYYGDRLTAIDTLPKLTGTRTASFNSAGEMVDEMFALLDEIEKKIG